MNICWNELDPDLSCIASKNVFKYKLKQLFLDRLSNLNATGYFAIPAQLKLLRLG